MEGYFSSHSTSSSNNPYSATGAPSKFQVERLIRHIDEVLAAITDKGLRSDLLHSRAKLSDIVQPVTSDFSKILDGISQGAKTISDQMSFSSNLSGEANKVASDVVQAMGNFHFAAGALLAIASVLDRVEKISSNDRDCLDLMKAMLDLAKSIKQLTDINLHSTERGVEKMTEGVHVICIGAIMCRSFLESKKIWKFLLTTKIREELVRLWRRVDSIKQDLVLQMQIMFSYSVSSYNMLRQPQRGLPDLTQEVRQVEIIEATEEDHHGMEQRLQLEPGAPVQHLLLPESGRVADDMEVVPNSNKRRWYEHLESLFHGISRLLKKITPNGHQNAARTILGRKLDAQLSLLDNTREFGKITCRFTVKELRMATKRFKGQLEVDTTNGIFIFYKGILWGSHPVVIKTLRSERENAGPGLLLNELERILSVNHRNILKLVGFCNEGDKLMLVYDYMVNGSLYDILHHPAKKKFLDWPTRLKILLGVIAAIAYIHHGLDTCIVHRAIKPSNILLDEAFNPRISDFGIAMPLQEATDGLQCPIRPLEYIAPEYFRNGNVTKKVDIYSFGIMALEVVSGRKQIDWTANMEDIVLLDRVVRLQQEGRLEELADPRLVEGRGYDARGIERTTMIALRCIEEDPNVRPSALRVLEKLSQVQVEDWSSVTN